MQSSPLLSTGPGGPGVSFPPPPTSLGGRPGIGGGLPLPPRGPIVTPERLPEPPRPQPPPELPQWPINHPQDRLGRQPIIDIPPPKGPTSIIDYGPGAQRQLDDMQRQWLEHQQGVDEALRRAGGQPLHQPRETDPFGRPLDPAVFAHERYQRALETRKALARFLALAT